MAEDFEGGLGSFLALVLKCAAALLIIYAVWVWTGDDIPTSWTVPVPAVKAPPPTPPPPPPPPAPQPAAKVPLDAEPMVTLESIDGRKVTARVLVITDSSVFIRREDGQTFDLPFDRLTPESREKVFAARTNRIFGAEK